MGNQQRKNVVSEPGTSQDSGKVQKKSSDRGSSGTLSSSESDASPKLTQQRTSKTLSSTTARHRSPIGEPQNLDTNEGSFCDNEQNKRSDTMIDILEVIEESEHIETSSSGNRKSKILYITCDMPSDFDETAPLSFDSTSLFEALLEKQLEVSDLQSGNTDKVHSSLNSAKISIDLDKKSRQEATQEVDSVHENIHNVQGKSSVAGTRDALNADNTAARLSCTLLDVAQGSGLASELDSSTSPDRQGFSKKRCSFRLVVDDSRHFKMGNDPSFDVTTENSTAPPIAAQINTTLQQETQATVDSSLEERQTPSDAEILAEIHRTLPVDNQLPGKNANQQPLQDTGMLLQQPAEGNVDVILPSNSNEIMDYDRKAVTSDVTNCIASVVDSVSKDIDNQEHEADYSSDIEHSVQSDSCKSDVSQNSETSNDKGLTIKEETDTEHNYSVIPSHLNKQASELTGLIINSAYQELGVYQNIPIPIIQVSMSGTVLSDDTLDSRNSDKMDLNLDISEDETNQSVMKGNFDDTDALAKSDGNSDVINTIEQSEYSSENARDTEEMSVVKQNTNNSCETNSESEIIADINVMTQSKCELSMQSPYPEESINSESNGEETSVEIDPESMEVSSISLPLQHEIADDIIRLIVSEIVDGIQQQSSSVKDEADISETKTIVTLEHNLAEQHVTDLSKQLENYDVISPIIKDEADIPETKTIVTLEHNLAEQHVTDYTKQLENDDFISPIIKEDGDSSLSEEETTSSNKKDDLPVENSEINKNTDVSLQNDAKLLSPTEPEFETVLLSDDDDNSSESSESSSSDSEGDEFEIEEGLTSDEEMSETLQDVPTVNATTTVNANHKDASNMSDTVQFSNTEVQNTEPSVKSDKSETSCSEEDVDVHNQASNLADGTQLENLAYEAAVDETLENLPETLNEQKATDDVIHSFMEDSVADTEMSETTGVIDHEIESENGINLEKTEVKSSGFQPMDEVVDTTTDFSGDDAPTEIKTIESNPPVNETEVQVESDTSTDSDQGEEFEMDELSDAEDVEISENKIEDENKCDAVNSMTEEISSQSNSCEAEELKNPILLLVEGEIANEPSNDPELFDKNNIQEINTSQVKQNTVKDITDAPKLNEDVTLQGNLEINDKHSTEQSETETESLSVASSDSENEAVKTNDDQLSETDSIKELVNSDDEGEEFDMDYDEMSSSEKSIPSSPIVKQSSSEGIPISNEANNAAIVDENLVLENTIETNADALSMGDPTQLENSIDTKLDNNGNENSNNAAHSAAENDPLTEKDSQILKEISQRQQDRTNNLATKGNQVFTLREKDANSKSIWNVKATSVTSSGSYGSQSYTPGTSKNEVFTDGGDADKSSLSVNELKGALSEIEDKYRRAMLQIAQLDNERTQLSYQSQQLQDLLEEQEEELYRVKKEHKKSCQEVEHQKQINYGLQKKIGDLQESLRQRDELIQDLEKFQKENHSLANDFTDLKETLKWKDKKIEALNRLLNNSKKQKTQNNQNDKKKEQGLVLIGDDGGSSYNSDPVALVSPEVAKLLEEAGEGPLDVRLRHLVEEKRDLEDQVRRLSDEIAEERNNRHNNHYESDVTENGLTEMQLLEVQREANRQVNEYKLKLQKSEQDLAAYHGNITRLESQLQRFKQTSEFYEKNEDEMRAEKRKLMRDLRTALDRIEEMEMTNSHLEKRLERIRASRTAISSQS